MDSSDKFVVTWENLNPDGTASVLMRYFNALGSPLTGITQVSALGSTDYQPDVAAVQRLRSSSPGPTISAATNDDIYAERFVISGGVPQGQGIFVVNADGNSEAHPSVAMAAEWDLRHRLRATVQRQRLGHLRQPVRRHREPGPRRRPRSISMPPPSHNPSISMDNNGNAVVAYEAAANGQGTGIYANRLSSGGVVSGRITVLAASFGNGEGCPSVALARTGGQFVVAYNKPTHGLQATGD